VPAANDLGPPEQPVPVPVPAGRPPTLPAWYPAWARELADLYYSGTTCLFILHGNVRDLIRGPGPDPAGDAQGQGYLSLSEFLATQVFGAWDLVLYYDLAHGLRPLAGRDPQRLQTMVQTLASRLGEPAGWPRDPETLLPMLDRLIERLLLEDDPARRKSVGILFDYAQYLVPAADLSTMVRGHGANLVRFLSWAQNPYIKRVNMAFCLVAEKLSEVNDRLVQSPHVATIAVGLPDRAERERFCTWIGATHELAKLTDFATDALADLSNGLSLVSLQVLLTQGKGSGRRLDAARFRQQKKAMIERQCQGLLEFLEPDHTLDLLVGQEAAKERLRQDAALIVGGRLDAVPMGYLICGPVGTGKSFLAECYAGSIGIPCVKLRNFRSKYVGETEGNLEQVLTVLRSLGPVVVVIDEADAALGTRQAGGDSGTSSRVFAMIAAQMGDTKYRGKVIWMLLTSRPELLPIDLKRQGRAEVHIPLFYPQDDAEIREMLKVLARKNKVALAADVDWHPATAPDRAEGRLSGSDLESILLAAQRAALAANRSELMKSDLDAAFHDFLPSTQGLEKELQELAAVLECSQLAFLPRSWKEQVDQPGGRAKLQERLATLRQRLDEAGLM
jgi:AAA+ superfamily predicted ATPase